MTYNEFERRLYNCDTILEIVQLCVEHPKLAEKYIERQELLKSLEKEYKAKFE